MDQTEQTTNPQDYTKMTRVQKLAVLLVMLGPESAAQILKNFDEHEVEVIAAEMSKFGLISQDLQRAILNEFFEVAVQASTSVRGGIDYTRAVLEKSLGVFKAADLLQKIIPARTTVHSMHQVSEMDARQIFNLIKNEQPQTIALVLSYLPPEKASQVLTMFRADTRVQIVERLATLGPAPIDVVDKVVQVLTQKVGSKAPTAMSQTGGVKTAADILNGLDKNLTKSLLITIEERNPELGQAIRQKMFTFQDLIYLDSASLQKILREVDMRDLAIALKSASEQLKSKLLSCISKRAAETVNEEMSFLGPVKIKDVEAAQNRIIEAVRNLESEGEIDLSEARENMRYAAMA